MDIANEKSPRIDPDEDYLFFRKLLGNYLKSERKKAGFNSATSFAIVIDMAESQYRKYERGETDIKLSSLLKIFKGLNKKIEDIFALNILGADVGNNDASEARLSLIETQVRTQVTKLNGSVLEKKLTPEEIERIFQILLFCFSPKKRRDILTHIKLANKTANFLMIFKLLLKNNWLAMQYPDKTNTPSQRYYTTEAGKAIIQIK